MKSSYCTLILIVCILLIGFPIQLTAATYDSASNAYERRDYNLAFEQSKELSNQNDPYAQYMLGRMYATGEGTKKDYVIAYKWLHLSEKKGISAAGKLKRKISKKMSHQQKTKAEQLIEDWLHPPSSPTQLSENLDPAVVRKVQQELTKRGYYFDKIDGVAGSRTRNAILRYQQTEGLVEDGKISNELLDRLHLVGSWANNTNSSTNWDQSNKVSDVAVFQKKLSKLISKAKKTQAAEPWLIERLEKLASLESNPWTNLVLHENFLADNYQRGSGWQIISGNFRLEQGTGLIGIAENSWGSSSSSNNNVDELAAILLNTVFKQSGRTQSDKQLAKIQNDIDFSNAFAFKLETGPIQSTEGLILSCGYNRSSFSGYRLVIQPGDWDQVKLFKVAQNNATEIKALSSQFNLDQTGPHTFEWTRSEGGVMAVFVNGQQLFQVDDDNFTDPFQQISIAHMGGQVILRDLQLHDSTVNGTRL